MATKVLQWSTRSCIMRNGLMPKPPTISYWTRSRPSQQQSPSLSVVAQAGSSSSSSSSGSSSSSTGQSHAVLHDFCMTIPYGVLSAAAALVAFLFKAPAVGLQLAGAAAVVGLCSVLSLKSWKARSSSTAYTLLSAGSSGWIAYQMWLRVAASTAPIPSGILLVMSAALSLFCVYNVLAGGNPPPSHKTA